MIEIGVKITATQNLIKFDNIVGGKKTNVETVNTREVIKNKDAQLRKIADEIKKDINRNLRQGLRFDGRGKVAKLKKSTIKRKGHSRVFLEKGILFKSVIVKKEAKGYLITLKDTRAEIGKYLQEGNENMAARPFFGVTKKRVNELTKKYMTKKLTFPSKFRTLFQVRTSASNRSGKLRYTNARPFVVG